SRWPTSRWAWTIAAGASSAWCGAAARGRSSPAPRTRRCSSTWRSRAAVSRCAWARGGSRCGPDVLRGAHVPTTGGLDRAPANGQAIGATAIQIFTRNKMQWAARPVDAEEAAAFHRALAASSVKMVVVHGSYLVNLASPIPEQLERSRAAFVAELERC